MAERGTEAGDQPCAASAFNVGGSWQWAENVKQRAKGYVAYGPVADPLKDEASNINFSNIVTMPIVPEPSVPKIFGRPYFGWMDSLHNAFDSLVNGQSPSAGRFYHEVQRRVPGIWECDVGPNTSACWYEAEMQFIREREIDRHILAVLEDRQRMCWLNQDQQWYDTSKTVDPCQEITAFKRQADMNYATKYKNLYRWGTQCTQALQKQKNRFIEKRWLERQGKSYEELQNMFHEPLTTAYLMDAMKWS